MRTSIPVLTAAKLFCLVCSACSGGNAGGADATAVDGGGVADAGGAADASGDGGTRSLAVVLHLGADSYPGGVGLLLAEVTAPAGLAVDLSVTSTPAIAGEVVPQRVVGGGVVEVLMRPTAAQVGQGVSVELGAMAGADRATDSTILNVIEYSDSTQRAQGDVWLAIFLEYLQANRSDLGLGPATTWLESWNSQPVLIVTHRSYLSDTWELHLAWHNTIPPDDWSYVTLRRRNQLAPDLAFCFHSQSGDHTVRAADLSDPRLPCATGQ